MEKLKQNKLNNREVAKNIVLQLEGINVRDWEIIKSIIDETYEDIKNQSNFSCSETTLKKIKFWF